MSFSVNTNAGAFAALGNLNRTSQSLDVTQSRINTGLKVASAKDNAAVYSIAQKLRGDVAGFNAVNNSLNRATSELDVAIAGAEAISDLLIEMKEKAVAAKDTGLDTASRISLNNDFVQLRAQVDSIANNATFNGKNLLTGDTVSAITDATGSSTISASATSLTTSNLSLSDSSLIGSGTSTTVTPRAINTGTTFGTVASTSGASADSDSSTAQAVGTYLETHESDVDAWLNSVFSTSLSAASYSFDSSTGLFTGTDGYKVAASVSNALNSDSDFGLQFFAEDDASHTGTVIIKNAPGSLYVVSNGADSYFTNSGTDVSVSGGGSASQAVDSIEAAITTVNDALSTLGATANRVAIQQSFAGKLSDSINIGIGNLVDADLARESANLQAFQTKQQLGLQALSIANQAPQTVLSLFR